MALETYRKKRNFRVTPEPRGRVGQRRSRHLAFVIQKHAARQLHYDFRLELDGVLLSWAVPKGPSLDPGVRRLAMHVEDHPIEYGDFEGIIPPKQYGSGTVMLWDRGTWMPKEDPREGYRKGRLKFELRGEKLKGGWMLVRTRGSKYGGNGKSWLLIKENDEHVRREDGEVIEAAPDSVATGRSLEEIAAAGDRVWHSNKSVAENVKAGAVVSSRRSLPRHVVGRGPGPGKKGALDSGLRRNDDLRGLRRGDDFPEGAVKAAMPAFIEPDLATLVKETPAGDDWLHEMKLDGYRMVCRIENGKAKIYTRNRNDWTAKFPSIAGAAAQLKVESAWLDGEIVVMLPNGLTSFQSLQNALSNDEARNIYYYLFDLPYLDGYDLRKAPLIERKKLLEKLLSSAPDRLRYSSHVLGSGEKFYANACELKLEGIVAKRAASPYRPGRGRDWLKVKCGMRQEMVIGGYTDPQRSRKGLGALLLGVYEPGGGLLYSGKVGTGFDEKTLASLRRKLDALVQDEPPFSNPPRGAEARRAHWVKPELVAEIAFTEWTEDGTLRHPSFQGLREDKRAEDVVRERPGESLKTAGDERVVAGVTISNPDKLLYPDAGITKRDVALYYEAVADWMLPHVRNRPLSLLRCPDGWKKCFFQKHATGKVSGLLERIEVKESAKTADYMMANSTGALAALAQMGVLEIHPWASTAKKLGHPDHIIFDLDPDDKLPWSDLVDAARQVRTALDEIGLRGFLKTTGGKGLHVVAPIKPTQPWAVIKDFTRAIAELFVKTFPDRFTAQASKAGRRGKIFIDYLRNAEGATAIAPYSLRARAGAPVALPIEWDELHEDLRFERFNLRNVPERLARRKGDPWDGFSRSQRAVTAAMMKRVGMKRAR
jgi:bifunctional non-homologous end joining protein LigD